MGTAALSLMPEPRVTALEEVLPWRYRSWDRGDYQDFYHDRWLHCCSPPYVGRIIVELLEAGLRSHLRICGAGGAVEDENRDIGAEIAAARAAYRPPTLHARVNLFAIRCFRDTGDGDYIAARLAMRARLYPQYLAAAEQAVEKYLKCILMLNRCDTKRLGHRLADAFDDVRTKLSRFRADRGGAGDVGQPRPLGL